MIGQADVLARYRQLREIGMRVHSDLVKRLPKDCVDSGGRRLEVLRKGVLVFDSEADVAVFMDFCIHDVRREGRNAVEECLVAPPYSPGSDELAYLRALEDAYYSIFIVESAEPGLGVHVRDLFRDERVLLVDVGFSRSAPVGTILATRVACLEGICMTTGAALPVGLVGTTELTLPDNVRHTLLHDKHISQMSPEERSEVIAKIIVACRHTGATADIEYRDPAPAPRRRRQMDGKLVGRNDPCPCSSGKKFKKCCGARS